MLSLAAKQSDLTHWPFSLKSSAAISKKKNSIDVQSNSELDIAGCFSEKC